MSVLGRIIEGLRAIGRSNAAVPGGRRHRFAPGRVRVRAAYDAAQTTDENRKHWSLADGLSADAAASPWVRRILRNRSRYEVCNNAYARGMVLTIANDCVGTGPRLQVTGIAGDDARLVERAFADWARGCDLAEKLRTLRVAQAEDGEAFALLTSNPGLNTRVKLDVRPIEADQVATPGFLPTGPERSAIDGIVFDVAGNPIEYHVLKDHPGAQGTTRFLLDSTTVPAASMLHCFRADRPGQRRGVPELTPALPLFAQLRRYTLAVLAAAETAADFAGVLYTDAPANGEADAVEPMDTVDLAARAMLTLPSGWKMGQVHAEQPATTYAEFKREVLNEIARCLNLPYNIAAGNSSGYNYASGRLDHQVYHKAIRVDQARCAARLLDPLFAAWVREAILIEGFLPQRLRTAATDWSHQWFWDGQEHVDPLKEAAAQAQRLASNTTTLADEYARKGQDWDEQLRQRARERALMRDLGLEATEPTSPGRAQPSTPGRGDPPPRDAPDGPATDGSEEDGDAVPV